MVRNSPSEQPWISKEEVEYIELSLAGDLQRKVWRETWLVSQNYLKWIQKDLVAEWQADRPTDRQTDR